MRAAIVLVLILLPSLATGLVVYQQAADALVAAERDKLSALMEVRRVALEELLDSLREEIRFWARNRIMREALVAFSRAWEELPEPEATLQRLYIHESPYPVGERDNLEFAADGSLYGEVHRRYHYWLRSFLLHRGVYDVFLFDPAGNLVYTSTKELDYATNLVTGPFRETDLGRAFRSARENLYPSYVAFFDFARYAPSHFAPALFLSAPVLDDAGEFLGVLAFQGSGANTSRILQVTPGMGETGESYLVGEDLLMRSDSRFSEESTILETTVDTVTARRALAGETGLEVTEDYRGIRVYSAYAPVRFEGTSWALLAEIDEAEVLRPVERLRNTALVAALALGLAAGGVGLVVLRRGGA